MGSALQLPRLNTVTALPDTVSGWQPATELEVRSNPPPPFQTPKAISVLRLNAPSRTEPKGTPHPEAA